MKNYIFVCILLFVAMPALAQIYNEQSFATKESYQIYKELINELRCLVCQNQNLANSDASLANDLRTIIFEKIEAGDSSDQIRSFMVDRYGNFVLYDPPLQTSTFLLWFGPVLLFFIAFVFALIYIFRQHRKHLSKQ